MKVGKVEPGSGPKKAAEKGGRGSRRVGSLGGRRWWEESLRLSCFWGSSVCTASSRERWTCLQDMGSEARHNSRED